MSLAVPVGPKLLTIARKGPGYPYAVWTRRIDSSGDASGGTHDLDIVADTPKLRRCIFNIEGWAVEAKKDFNSPPVGYRMFSRSYRLGGAEYQDVSFVGQSWKKGDGAQNNVFIGATEYAVIQWWSTFSRHWIVVPHPKATATIILGVSCTNTDRADISLVAWGYTWEVAEDRRKDVPLLLP